MTNNSSKSALSTALGHKTKDGSQNAGIDDRLLLVNQRLKIAQMGFQIEQRGQKLSLRGKLPPRPGSPRLRSHQQRLSLNIPATLAGLKQAEQEVKIIAAQLIQNAFDWSQYLPVTGGGRLSQMNLAEKLRAFEQHFFEQAEENEQASTKTTWEKAYAPYLRKLETIAQSHSQLSLAEAIYATVQATDRNSRSRQVCCTALVALAEFLKVELPKDMKTLWGKYSPNHTQMRSLPTDEQILEAFHQIKNPNWQFVYGIMATYGLRNHEVFFCNYSALTQGSNMIEVLDTTKTGNHEVWAFYPEWVEQFNLRQVRLPKVSTDLSKTTLQRVGQLVTNQFRRDQIPFSPYDLRHAWAVRTIHFGLPDTVAARMMGHSVAIHTRTYHRWITRRDQQMAVETALRNRESR
jgi:integrase